MALSYGRTAIRSGTPFLSSTQADVSAVVGVVDRRVKPQRRVARWEGGGGSRLGLAAASGERVPGAPIREGAPEPGTAVEAFGIRPRIRRSVRVGRICEKPVNACRLPKSLAEALPWKRDPTNLAAAGPEGIPRVLRGSGTALSKSTDAARALRLSRPDGGWLARRLPRAVVARLLGRKP
jgi:hypothetical protein